MKNLHIFSCKGKTYVFNPSTIRVTHLNPDEVVTLENVIQSHLRMDDIDPVEMTCQKTNEIINDVLRRLQKESPSNFEDEFPLPDRVEVLVNVSQICNLACDYCFVDGGKFGFDTDYDTRLSPEHAKRLIEALPDGIPGAQEFCIHFYGGEPLLNIPAIETAVTTANKTEESSFTFAVTTNGTVVSKDAFEILQHGRFSIVLSIDGPAHIHDDVRRTVDGKPTHSQVLRFLKQVQQDGLYIRASSVVRKGWSLREARDYLKSLNVDVIKAQAIRVSPEHPLALSVIERQQYIEHLREVAEEVMDCLKKGNSPIDDRFNSRVLQLLTRTRRTSFCGAGRWTFGLAADGTVYPCALLAGQEDMILGQIDEPAEMWVRRGMVWVKSHGPREACRDCWALPLCGGGCPVMFAVCGEDECELIRANCELALVIYSAFYPDKLDSLLNLSWLLEGNKSERQRSLYLSLS